MIQNCSFMICRVLRSSCRETKDRPRRTPSHCSRPPFQFFKSVRVAAQAAGTTYLGVAPNWEDFIATHTSDNTPSAMRGKLLKDYRVRKAKAKKPCISALPNKTICTFHKEHPWQHLENTVPRCGSGIWLRYSSATVVLLRGRRLLPLHALAPYGATAWHMWMCTK